MFMNIEELLETEKPRKIKYWEDLNYNSEPLELSGIAPIALEKKFEIIEQIQMKGIEENR